MARGDQLTEQQARELLEAAARTIDAQPVPVHLPPPEPPSRWSWVAVAGIAIAVVAAASWALTGGISGGASFDPSPDPSPLLTAAPWKSVDLADDQIPSVFGYDAGAARGMLQQAGLRVTTRPEATAAGCRDAGRALATSPAVGTHFQPGDDVTLTVGYNRGSCTGPESTAGRVWQFVDFAAGRTPPPPFAPQVKLSVNGDTVRLPARQADQLVRWPICSTALTTCPGNAADVVAAAARRVQKVGKGYTEPTLQADHTAQTDTFTIVFPVEGLAFYPRWQVTLTWHSAGQGAQPLLAGVDLTWLESPSSSVSSGGAGTS